jgi:AraC-like DNA-binding protein
MLLLSFFGIFFSILLLAYNKGYKSANVYLALFMFLCNLIIFINYLYFYNDSKVIRAILLSFPINSAIYLLGPLAFFYVRSILNDNIIFAKYDWLHFLVFLLFVIGRFPYIFLSWESKLLIAEDIINHSRINVSNSIFNIFLPTMLNFKLKGIHFLLYILFIWLLIFEPKTINFSFNEWLKKIKSVNKWLFFFTVIISLLCISMFLIVLHILTTKNRFIFQNETNIIFSIVFIEFIVLIFGLILNPKILYNIPQAKESLEVRYVEVPDSEKSTVEIFSLDFDYTEKIRLLIKNWKEELKFLDVDSSISSLSKDINLPTYHVTYFFTYVNNEKYIDWRNRLRVEYAIHLMNRKTGYNKTIESMGKECGFRSYATFIQSFKKVTGKLPKDYLKDLNS